MDKYYLNNSEISIATIAQPETSDWELHFSNFVLQVPKNNEPNWFHRKMHYWFFGFKWVNVKKKK